MVVNLFSVLNFVPILETFLCSLKCVFTKKKLLIHVYVYVNWGESVSKTSKENMEKESDVSKVCH